MAFTIGEEYLPAILTAEPMSDEEFAELCAGHPDLFFEMSAEGDLLVMPPNYSITGMRHSQVLHQLTNWAHRDGRGAVTDAASGFVLPSGARRSPADAWTLKSRIHQMDPKMLERYWHLCPDFVIEVRSHTDRLPTLRKKMREWISIGAQLAWMLDPGNRSVEIYRPRVPVDRLENPTSLAAGAPLAGFVLDLIPVWDPLQN